MSIRIYIFNFLQKKQTTATRKKKPKETKEEKRISVQNLTGYDNIVCDFALCTFNLLAVYVQREKSQYLLHHRNI